MLNVTKPYTNKQLGDKRRGKVENKIGMQYDYLEEEETDWLLSEDEASLQIL